MIMADMQWEKKKSTRTKPWVTPLFKIQGGEEEPGIETVKEQIVT